MGDTICRVCGRMAKVCLACAGLSEDPPWTPFAQASPAEDTPEARFAFEGCTIWLNSRYQVAIRVMNGSVGELHHLSIKRLDKRPIHDWRELQRIKNELVGPEAEAVEIYPRESNLMDTSNQFHLWVFPTYEFPFGYKSGRLVTEAMSGGSIQRPFPDDAKPADLKNEEELQKMKNKMLGDQSG